MEALSQILKTVPTQFISGLLLNGGLITLTFFLVWKKFRHRLRNFKIQLQERFNQKQLKRELKNSLVTLLIAALYSSLVTYLGTQGYTRVYLDYESHSPLWAIFGFFIILLIDDAWFYWMHRLLHHPKLYRYVHRVHHESIDVNPFTSMSFHWIEAALLTLWILPASLIMPIYAPVLGLVQVWGLFDNLKGHMGYEFFPSYFNRSWLRFMTTSTHHSMHHSQFNGNYSVHFRFWDRLLGTEFKGYEAEFEAIQQRKKGMATPTTKAAGGKTKAEVTLNWNGTLHTVEILEGETLLEASLRADLAVPFACKRGKCGTCACILTQGEVNMARTDALDTEELNQGKILACQSAPVTDTLEVKYP